MDRPPGCSPIKGRCVHLLGSRSDADPVSAHSTLLHPFQAVLWSACGTFGVVGAVHLAEPAPDSWSFSAGGRGRLPGPRGAGQLSAGTGGRRQLCVTRGGSIDARPLARGALSGSGSPRNQPQQASVEGRRTTRRDAWGVEPPSRNEPSQGGPGPLTMPHIVPNHHAAHRSRQVPQPVCKAAPGRRRQPCLKIDAVVVVSRSLS